VEGPCEVHRRLALMRRPSPHRGMARVVPGRWVCSGCGDSVPHNATDLTDDGRRVHLSALRVCGVVSPDPESPASWSTIKLAR
jgi:hypothetical protein